MISPNNTFLGILIYEKDTKLDRNYVLGKLRNCITFINFIQQDPHSALWLISNLFSDIGENIEKTNSLDQILSKLAESEKSKPDFLYKNLNQLSIPGFQKNFQVNFIELLDKFYGLSSNNEVLKLINLLSFSYITTPCLSNFYENTNLEISLAYIVFEELLKMELNDFEEIKTCPKCGHKHSGRKSEKKLISEFVSKFGVRKNDKKLLNKIIMNIRSIRNDFSHEGKVVTVKEHCKIAFGGASGTITIGEEAEKGQSRLSGLLHFKCILKALLLQKLINQN